MTEEQQDFVYTQEWLAEKLQRDKEQQETAQQETAQERAIEEIRQAWLQKTGVAPTRVELEATLAEKRRADVAETARRNEAYASAAIRRAF